MGLMIFVAVMDIVIVITTQIPWIDVLLRIFNRGVEYGLIIRLLKITLPI